MNQTGASTPMPQYQSHKKLWALKITSVEHLGTDTTTDENLIVQCHFEPPFAPRKFNLRSKPTPQAGWYYVQYEDGYESFSPGETFEKSNTLIKPADTDFERELASLINRHSKETGSDTPDFILASYLFSCLSNFDRCVLWRNKWYSPQGVPFAERDNGPDPTEGNCQRAVK